MDEYAEQLKDLRISTLKEEHPEKTLGELEQIYDEEKRLESKREKDADAINGYNHQYLDIAQVAYLLSQSEKCKTCIYMFSGGKKRADCESCGYCIWEELGLLGENDSKLMEQKYIKLFRLMGSSFYTHYGEFLELEKMKEQIEKDLEEIRESNSSKSMAYRRLDTYKEWFNSNPRPTKAALAREMGLSTRQVSRDLRTLHLEP